MKNYEDYAGTLAGKVWMFLNENEKATEKEIMKAMKSRKSTEFYLALGWLLREGKIEVIETSDSTLFKLK